MSTIRLGMALLLAVTASCYQDSAYAQGTMPQPMPQQQWYGPPGGGMDPQAQPQDPSAQQGYADPNDPYAQQGYVDPNAQAAPVDPNQQVDPNAQAPQDDAMADVTDSQIDSTLDGYGTWEPDADYGQVWVPSATVVGVDFTPYETCGSWVWSDYGWMYNCSYGWGWLPFHYGRWGWFGDHWGWVRGHHWGPAWVDWRHGGGYVGWRPSQPAFVRDHRGRLSEPMDSHWRFTHESQFAGNIHGHLFQNPAEGLRVTSAVARPPVRSAMPAVHASSLMSGRVAAATPSRVQTFHQPAMNNAYRPPMNTYRQPMTNTYRPPMNTYRPPVNAYRQPMNTYRPPMNTYRAPRNTYRPPRNT